MDNALNVQKPLPRAVAARAVVESTFQSAKLLARRQTHLPKRNVGLRLHFADGTTGTVFRETVVERQPPDDPCLLMVEFKLRLLKGRWHALFLWECILNTPLFVGFPGLMSKLWLDRDELDRYRGFYEWDDPVQAQFYARSLWRILELVCPDNAIHYAVVPGVRRDDALKDPQLMTGDEDSDAKSGWWRLDSAEF